MCETKYAEQKRDRERKKKSKPLRGNEKREEKFSNRPSEIVHIDTTGKPLLL